ncbi:MAG: alcohol dehydrogenase [Acidimicrobiia bacterium]|nr:MAG: alcohol dehydrogenase [Acidimicrobiia bacterium]
MEAAVLERYGAALNLVRRPTPTPPPGWVLLDVRAAGVCGSDLFLQKGGFDSALPIVPGHEASGIVVAVGEDVQGIQVGTPAALYYIDHCGICDMCRGGYVNMCRRARRMGVDFDGAFAEQVLVPGRCIIPVSCNMDPVAVAVLTDAVATPYHALTSIAQVKPGETVLVLGVGGIGSNAVQLAKHLGCRVLASTRSSRKLELAVELGADVAIPADALSNAVVGQHTDGKGPDVVIQTVGSGAVDRSAIEVAGVRTRIILVGASTESFKARSTEFIWRELTVSGSRGYTPKDIRAVIDLYQSGAITLNHLTSVRRPLREINEAIEDLRHGRVLRSVIEVGSSW